jgi:hypothetical protein
MYTKHNFHNGTFCIWKEVKKEEIASYKIHYSSKSGSEYFFTETGVYRISNHWGRVSNCRWRLLPLSDFKNQNKTVAFANWDGFLPNDEEAKLFYITVNLPAKEVSFEHAQNKNYSGKEVLRNASDTTKRIQIITEIYREDSWAKYLNYQDYNKLQIEVIEKLINQNKTWLEIKKEYL